jgi:hypothetical protein
LADLFEADDDPSRQRYRAAQTAAVREQFHAWLVTQQALALPKSPLAIWGHSISTGAASSPPETPN